MDHVVCLNSDAHELEDLVSGCKSMIIRGYDWIDTPCANVREGDTLYFIKDAVAGTVVGSSIVCQVFRSGKLTKEESFATIIRNQDKLQLPDNQFYSLAGKEYLVLIGLKNTRLLRPFGIDKSLLRNSGCWYEVGDIGKVAIKSIH